nr:hypothetical protein 27 [Balneolaceae bacterium]
MITVTLSKSDLLNLVTGTQPQLSQIKDFQNRNLGSFTGGHVDKWGWNHSHLKTLDEQQLWDIYEECARDQRHIELYQESWKATWAAIINRMHDDQRKDLQWPDPSQWDKEAIEIMESTGKVYRQYVSEKQYENVKTLGPYQERTIQGVDILIDHSHDSLQEFIIIKTPTWEGLGKKVVEDLNQ